MLARKSTKLSLTDWEVETLLNVTRETSESKGDDSSNVEKRETFRTSTRLPCSTKEKIHLEEPPSLLINKINLGPVKNRCVSNRSLKNCGVS